MLIAVWTSKSVTALIAPGLCVPVILGLPFLIHNCIVTDHAAHTCIDKNLNYDLLNPLPVKWCSYSSRVVILEENWREADNVSALIPMSEQLQGAQLAGSVVSKYASP